MGARRERLLRLRASPGTDLGHNAVEGVPEMTKKSTKAEAPDWIRFSANRKTEAILRLLRGEDLEALSRELGVTAATISLWGDAFLDGGKAVLKSRPADDRDELIARLQAKVGQVTMD